MVAIFTVKSFKTFCLQLNRFKIDYALGNMLYFHLRQKDLSTNCIMTRILFHAPQSNLICIHKISCL
ncbi:hypothetical protein V1477_002211 [Vespula maculifrons]|uniref:Uncharacterized protein n=1 Tax=Vespula maculifrons TaxID=7453 RepID=A0ABD2CVY6_VESMC